MSVKPTDDISYLSTLSDNELVERASQNPTSALAIVLAQRLAPTDFHGRQRRVAPNHPAFYGV